MDFNRAADLVSWKASSAYSQTVLVELDYLEVKLLVDLSLRAVFLYKVLGSCEAFNTVGKCYDTALVLHLDDGSRMDAAHSEY